MNLSTTEYKVFHDVFVVDEFRMTDDSGGLVTVLDERFIDALCSHMGQREATTGDLSPIVIGHTDEGKTEVEQPQIVGYARGWKKLPFFNTGKTGAAPDFWIKNENKIIIGGEEHTFTADEVMARWPRRSSEVWTSRHEIDPISLLGATTPARDLGPVIKLNRSGSFTYSPGVNMNPQSPAIAAPVAPVDAAAAGQSAPMEKLQATMDQILAALTKLTSPEPAGDPNAAPAAPGAPGAGGDQGGELSDEELEQLLGGAGGDTGAQGAPQGAPAPAEPDDASRKGEKPVQNNAVGYPGGANTHVTDPRAKLSRQDQLEADLNATRTELARMQLSARLSKLRDKESIDVDPEDQELIGDLAAQPPDMRERSMARLVKLSRKAPVQPSFNLENAVNQSTNGVSKRIPSVEENVKVIKLARDKNIQYEDAAREMGYSL